jgi:hypothetical protein
VYVPDPQQLTEAIKFEVEDAIGKVSGTLNRLNRKKARDTAYSTIVIDEDFKKIDNPLPPNTPNFIKNLKAPVISYPEGMADDDELLESKKAVETQLRVLQATVFSAVKLSAKAEVRFYETELTSIRAKLVENVTAHLLEMQFMSDERRQRKVTEACTDFDKKMEAEIDKIEDKRVRAKKDLAAKAKRLEDEKLKQLETTSNSESLAAVTRAVVREELALAAIEDNDGAGEAMDEERESQVKQTNAALNDKVVNLVHGKNGRAARAQKTQQSTRKQQQKPSARKQQQNSPAGKGNGQQQQKKKGKGGRAAGDATKAKKKGGRGAQ